MDKEGPKEGQRGAKRKGGLWLIGSAATQRSNCHVHLRLPSLYAYLNKFPPRVCVFYVN